MTTTGFASSPTIRLRSARDVLAAIPHLLGYRPAECVVVAGVTGRGRLGPLVHVTLADLPIAGAGRRHTVAQRVGAAGATSAVVGVYTERAEATVRALVDPLQADLEGAVGDVDAWLVTAEGFRGLDCADPACCPPAGHPRVDLESGAVGAAFVLSGSSVARTAEEAFDIPRAPRAARDLAGRAARRSERAGQAARSDAGTRREWEHDGLSVWRDAVRHAATERELATAEEDTAGEVTVPGRVPLPPASLGRLAASLAATIVRDAVLMDIVAQACPADGGGRAPWEPGPDLDQQAAEACGRLLDPSFAVFPGKVATSVVRAVLEATVAHAPRRLQPAPLTLLALVAWWRGEGGLAGARVRAALEIDDGYRLAVLVQDILAAGIPPGWVGRSWAEGVR